MTTFIENLCCSETFWINSQVIFIRRTFGPKKLGEGSSCCCHCCPALTKLALDLHVNFCLSVCLSVCVSGLFFKASNWMIYWLLTVVLAPYLSN